MSLDLDEPIVLTGTDISRELARLRARGPLARIELPGGVPAWAVTDTNVLKELMTSAAVSKDPYKHWPALIDGRVTPEWVMWPWVAVRSMLVAYGIEHRRLRHVLAPAFTYRRIQSLRARIEAITTELLDRLAGMDNGETVDLRAGFADELPIRVICELMGVPAGRAAQLCAHTTAILDVTVTSEQAAANFEMLGAVLGELIADKKAHSGDDVTSLLLAALREGRLSEQELADTLLLIVTAGHETTAHLIDQVTVALLTRSGLRADVVAGTVPWAAVIEETLRLEPPIIHMPMRFAVEDIDVGGVRIARGDVILATLAAAGRDPQTHTDPETFDPRRPVTQHLAFGHGAHYCLGAPLARLEAAIALPALFTRFPDLALAVDSSRLERRTSIVINGHQAIPARLSLEQAS